MKAVLYRDWPVAVVFGKRTGLAGRIEADFDQIAKSLSASPKTFTDRATKTHAQVRYRSIFLVLSNGSPAALTEYIDKPGLIDVKLEIKPAGIAYDDDFAELISQLRVPAARARKFEEHLTWLPRRKKKKAPAARVPIPDSTGL